VKASIKVTKFNFNSSSQLPHLWELRKQLGPWRCRLLLFLLLLPLRSLRGWLIPSLIYTKASETHELDSKPTLASPTKSRNAQKTPPFCAVVSSTEPRLLAAAAESSSVLPGADAVGESGASAWLGPRFRSVRRTVKSEGGDARFFDLRGGGALTLDRLGGGTDEEDGDVEGRLVAELQRVSTMAFAGSEGGSASSPPLFHHPSRGIPLALGGSAFFVCQDSGDCAS
jgi:hypothetical protein